MIFLVPRFRGDPEPEEKDAIFAILFGWLALIIVWAMAAYLIAIYAHHR